MSVISPPLGNPWQEAGNGAVIPPYVRIGNANKLLNLCKELYQDDMLQGKQVNPAGEQIVISTQAQEECMELQNTLDHLQTLGKHEVHKCEVRSTRIYGPVLNEKLVNDRIELLAALCQDLERLDQTQSKLRELLQWSTTAKDSIPMHRDLHKAFLDFMIEARQSIESFPETQRRMDSAETTLTSCTVRETYANLAVIEQLQRALKGQLLLLQRKREILQQFGTCR
eukprot:Clim_evm88s149 gene=Clim_evmTU88s149